MLAFAVAWAEPAALRAATPAEATAELGAPALSVAGWARPDVGIGGWVRADLGSAGLAVGWRRLPERFGWTAHLAGGPVLAAVGPAFGVHASAALGLARIGDASTARIAVVAPVSVALAPRPEARLPVLVEGALAWRVGSVWLGGRGGAGLIATPGRRPSIAVAGGLTLGVSPGRRSSGRSATAPSRTGRS